MSEPYGYLLVHFVEAPEGHGEQIYFSLSRGDDPTQWDRLNDGEPVLGSTLGSTGVRDPHLVRSPLGGYHLIATDLRVFGGDDGGWDRWQRHGSRSLVVWDSDDLLNWSGPRLAEVAPPEAGMAWAPESIWDPSRSAYVVTWSSTLFDPADPAHEGETYSRILYATTTDFVRFSPARVYLDTGSTTIDTTMTFGPDGRVYRFHKDNGPGGRGLYADVVSGVLADDGVILAERIGRDVDGGVEGPLVFKDNHADRWYLWIDQYSAHRHGYRPYVTDDLSSGRWEPYEESFDLPENTKHGVVLPLVGDEWARLKRGMPR